VSARTVHAAYRVGDALRRVEARLEGESLRATVDGETFVADVQRGGAGEVILRVGGRRVRAIVARRGTAWLVSVGGRTVELSAATPGEGEAGTARADPFALAPMTGLLAKVHVKAGESVDKGAPLFAVEAMKMEYVVRADRAVVVAEVKRKAGDRVSIDEPIVTFREP
jgi:propionyl-CoA carboxylase alpha chain